MEPRDAAFAAPEQCESPRSQAAAHKNFIDGAMRSAQRFQKGSARLEGIKQEDLWHDPHDAGTAAPQGEPGAASPESAAGLSPGLAGVKLLKPKDLSADSSCSGHTELADQPEHVNIRRSNRKPAPNHLMNLYECGQDAVTKILKLSASPKKKSILDDQVLARHLAMSYGGLDGHPHAYDGGLNASDRLPYDGGLLAHMAAELQRSENGNGERRGHYNQYMASHARCLGPGAPFGAPLEPAPKKRGRKPASALRDAPQWFGDPLGQHANMMPPQARYRDKLGADFRSELERRPQECPTLTSTSRLMPAPDLSMLSNGSMSEQQLLASLRQFASAPSAAGRSLDGGADAELQRLFHIQDEQRQDSAAKMAEMNRVFLEQDEELERGQMKHSLEYGSLSGSMPGFQQPALSLSSMDYLAQGWSTGGGFPEFGLPSLTGLLSTATTPTISPLVSNHGGLTSAHGLPHFSNALGSELFSCPSLRVPADGYGSALLDRMQEANRQKKKKGSGAALYAAAPLASSLSDGYKGYAVAPPAKAQQRKKRPGPISCRDKIWGLFSPQDQQALLSNDMNAATATKKLLDQRMVELGLSSITELPEDDDWGVGYKLTEGKATANPLEKPKSCSICQRHGMVFHRHSYYCRRCAQLYRAIHRKKNADSSHALDDDGADEEVSHRAKRSKLSHG